MLRFADSFDHYAKSQMLRKWSAETGTGSQIVAGSGRFGTSCWRSRSGNAERMDLQLDSRQEWWVGFAFRVSAALGFTSRILNWADGASGQIGVRMAVDGRLQIERNGTTLATATTILKPNVFYYVEFYVKIDNATGAYDLVIDGTSEASASGVDTQNTANATASRLIMGKDVANNFNADYDDFYVCDDQGAGPTNAFLGDIRVEALFPNGNGNSSVLVGSDGNSVDNYLLVDETQANDDTDYVQGSTVGNKDTYAYTNPSSTSGSVYAVQPLPLARKTDAGVRSIATVARLAATEEDGANKALSASYAYLSDIRETKPGGGAWSLADVGSAEFGVKVTV